MGQKNKRCTCGCGKKARNCAGLNNFRQTKEFRPFVTIKSKNGGNGSMSIHSIKTYSGSNLTNSIENNIALSTNTGGGDRDNNSEILLTTNKDGDWEISTLGNAQLKSENIDFGLSIPKNLKKIKDEISGLMARIKIDKSEVEGVDCWGILIPKMGITNQNPDGTSNRPHITLRPNGTWSNALERSFKINIKCVSSISNKICHPKQVIVRLFDYNRDLILNFEYIKDENNVILSSVLFKDAIF